MSESLNGLTMKEIFSESGFNPEVLGDYRMKSFAKKWRNKYREHGVSALKDTRVENLGRPRKSVLTPEQQIEKLQSKITLLEEENNLLKKSEWSERRQERSERPSDVFERIHHMKTNGS